MKKLIVLCFLFSELAFAQCHFKNIGHRGGSSYYYPENTLASLRQAFIEGAWACEVDVRGTSDSVLVLMHDDMVDRTTNGHGMIADLPFDYVMTLDAGKWKGQEFEGSRVPALVEALQLAYEYDRKLYLNMKIYEPVMLANAIAQSGVSYSTVLIDPDDLVKVQEYHALMPQVSLVYFGPPPADFYDASFYLILVNNNVTAVELYAGDLLDTSLGWPYLYLDMLHSYGIELWAYTVNDNGYMHFLKDFGIDGLETDRPAEAENIFCYDQAGGFFPEKRVTGQWDFSQQGTAGTTGSQLVEAGDNTMKILFGTASDFGIPLVNGANIPVAEIPAYDPAHYLIFFSNIAPQGNPGGLYCDNDYTLVIDFLKPASVSPYISLFQTSNNNSDDGDLFIRGADHAIGILGNYFGYIADSTWYRLTVVFNLPQEVIKLYLDGAHIGDVPVPSGLDGRFCINNNWGVQPTCLFSDDDGETSVLYVSSIQVKDYAMDEAEAIALGAASASKIPADIDISGEACPEAPVLPEILTACAGDGILIPASAGDDVNYRWQINTGTGWSDCNGQHFSHSADDTLRVLVADTTLNNVALRCRISNNCVTHTTPVLLAVGCTGIQSPEPPAFDIAPNPGNGNFMIHYSGHEQAGQVSILNLAGSKISSFAGFPCRISVSLPDGVYIMEVNEKGRFARKLFVVQN